MRIVHQDAPDFVLHHGSGSFGVEVVEAIPRQLAHAYAVVNAAIEAGEPVPDVMSFRHLQSERKSTTRKAILGRIDPRNADPWLGDEPERLWLDVMRRVIENKCSKASRYGNRENLHLLITDEVASGADPERAWRLLLDQHDLMAASGATFAAIHVLSQRKLYSRRFA
ncbi:MAG: hypothetical protein MEQ74_03480 [Paracoccus sp.]|nr:hypothetical protein [Paracoccus sp. (in: a-proteobacteria)]